jgi:hypothetical protein
MLELIQISGLLVLLVALCYGIFRLGAPRPLRGPAPRTTELELHVDLGDGPLDDEPVYRRIIQDSDPNRPRPRPVRPSRAASRVAHRAHWRPRHP